MNSILEKAAKLQGQRMHFLGEMARTEKARDPDEEYRAPLSGDVAKGDVGPSGTPFGKPKPEKKTDESKKDYASKLISHHMHHVERHPGGQKQAVAIGLREAGVAKKAMCPKCKKSNCNCDAIKACQEVSKMIGGPSVGSGGTSTPTGPSVGGGGAKVSAGPSVGMGKSEDAEKAYLGEVKIGKEGAKYSGGAMPEGTKVGKPTDIGAAAEKISPTTGKVSQIRVPRIHGSEVSSPAPGSVKVDPTGGGRTNGHGGPSVLTSAAADPKAAPKSPGLKTGQVVSMESVSQKKVAAIGKAMEDLMEKAHGGKGPAKTGPTPFDNFCNHPGKGPAKNGPFDGFHDPAKGRSKTGQGEIHEPGAPGRTKQHSAAVHEPGAPGRTKQRSISGPACPAMNKAVTAMAVPRMPRALAAQIDAWRSGTAVMTTGNSRYSGQVQPYQLDGGPAHSAAPDTVAKSNYNTCVQCGRTYMHKSFPDGCPSCMISKSSLCPKGHQLSKNRDGGYQCSICG